MARATKIDSLSIRAAEEDAQVLGELQRPRRASEDSQKFSEDLKARLEDSWKFSKYLKAWLEDSQKFLEDLEAQLAQSEERKKDTRKSMSTATTMLKESEEKCGKLQKKYWHWKARSLRYLKELSFAPWL